MTSGECFLWTILSIVGLLMLGCKDKSDKGRPTSTAPSATSLPERSGTDRPLIGLTGVWRPGRGRNNDYVRVGLAYVRCVTEAVGDVGSGLKVVVRSEDGIIEALEMSGGRF